MRILYFHNSIPEYRKQFFLLLANQCEHIHFVFTIMSYSKKVYNTEVNDETLDQIEHSILSEGAGAIWETRKIIHQYNPDIIILPALDTFREMIIAFTILMSVRKEVKLIYFWEKWEAPFEYSNIRKRIKNKIQELPARIVFSKVDAFLSPGKKSTEYFISKGAKKDKINVFHDVSIVNKCETINLRETYNIASAQKIFLYYGRIIKRKGLDDLIVALSMAKNKDNIFLLVAGDGEYKKECELLVKEKKLSNVLFVGYINPEKKYQFFSQADVFVLPSNSKDGTIEAWGLTVNEALSMNCFVICSDVVGAAYDLVSENNGVVFKQGSIFDLANAIDYAFNYKKTSAFYQDSYRITSEYSYENMVKDFLKVFDKLNVTNNHL